MPRGLRITTIGGGPGGLYAGILLARADPSARITVLERNAPDDTFGWGVVFSAATLAELADADAPSHDALMSACARWDPVDVRYAGRTIRGRGNRFAAISRKRLLQILQGRCRELGVDLRFGCEVGDVGEHRDADLVIAADGANSRARQALAAAFGPKLVREGGKFIWLGTTLPLDAFTFVFTEHDAGPFQVHAYPFDEHTSTWIVECDEATWRRAGLDATDASALAPGENDEHALRFCEELFAEHLDGHRLLGNNSRWLDWHTVSNRRWHAGNVVLLGDAAHTAHFSIGSGTKLAMEDAIALARALPDAPDVPAALAAYESDRLPAVLRLQEAAGESLEWFARYHRYLHFDAPAFAYSLLTRSTRVTYESMRARDSAFVASYDRWYAERSLAEAGQAPGAPLLVPPQPAFTPFAVGRLALSNRLVVTPGAGLRADGGLLDGDALRRLADLGSAGAGLLLVDLVATSAHGRITPEQPGLYTEEHERRLGEVLDLVRAGQGSPVGVQLVHAGPRGATRPRSQGVDRPLGDGAWPLVAPSPLAYAPWSQVPAALGREGMEAVLEDFVEAARRAERAGVDLVELHMAHGYLLGAFLSPLTNRREDAYGGSAERRLAFPLEVMRAVRAALGPDVTLSVCLGASDLHAGGVSEGEVVDAARALAAEGVELFDVVAGQTTWQSAAAYGTAHYAPWADLVRNRARVPVVASGSIPTPLEASHVLAAGRADLCVLGRPLPAAEPWVSPEEGEER
jgi:anthraniloyl-CoA monooxygenase